MISLGVGNGDGDGHTQSEQQDRSAALTPYHVTRLKNLRSLADLDRIDLTVKLCLRSLGKRTDNFRGRPQHSGCQVSRVFFERHGDDLITEKRLVTYMEITRHSSHA